MFARAVLFYTKSLKNSINYSLTDVIRPQRYPIIDVFCTTKSFSTVTSFRMTRFYLVFGCFLCFLLAQKSNAQQNYPVRFASGTVLFPENMEQALQGNAWSPGEIQGGYYVRYVQFRELLSTEARRALESKGLVVVGYVQFGAYLMAIPQQFDLHQLQRLGARSVVVLKPEWKMARSLREKPYGKWAVNGDKIDVNLQVYPHIGIETGASLCARAGLKVLKKGTQNGFIQVQIPQNDVEKVVLLPFVQFMELIAPPGKPEDALGRSLHRSNLLDSEFATGRKYNGEGVSVLVRDDGQLGPHIDFQGRLVNVAEGTPESGTHGDGVGGIMAGAGNLDPSKRGMAAGARVFTTDYENSYQDTTLWLHLNENVTITNSSYSDGCNVGYTLAAQTVDQQIFEHPTLSHVFSAGNSNNNDCDYGAGTQWGNITGGHKQSKNAIATANLFADATLEVSSSRGPAYDGRLKPDIAANGQDQESTNPNNGYQVFGGTSGAAPGIAGCLAQLTQAYKTLHNGEEPASALLKACIMNTANDLGNVGPDYKFGWGHVNTFAALRLLEANRWRMDSVGQKQTKTHTLQIPPNTRHVRVMVYWAEPPAMPNANQALLNDLDLTMTSATNVVSLPWKLDPTPDPAILAKPAGKGRDSLNNMEQVAIDNPPSGLYTIKITGTEVPFGPQPYYLVWEILNDAVKVVYPNGGEGVAPGDTLRLHWDAYGTANPFVLRYSVDNGATFLPIIGNLNGATRWLDWKVPATVLSDKVRFTVIRGAFRDTSDFAFTIAPALKNVAVAKVCPDSMTLSWDKVNDTLDYRVYLLGEKYMDPVGVAVNTNSFTFAIKDPQLEKWVAAAPQPIDNAGKRSLAIRWEGGLKNCAQPEDVAVKRSTLLPDAIVRCDAGDQLVTVQVVNEGQNILSAPVLHYQLNSEPPVSETLPDLAPGDTLRYSFQKGIFVDATTKKIDLKIWSDYPGDDYRFNDSLVFSIPVVAQSSGPYVENLEGPDAPPAGWLVVNPDGQSTWERSDTLIGADGRAGTAYWVNCYDYQSRGEEDYLYTLPVSLVGLSQPAVRFDLANAGFDATYNDQLRLELLPNCDATADPVVIWEKAYPDLGTVPDQTNSFFPGDEADWRAESADLSNFAGQQVILRFVSTNDFGNNMYIDNIGVVNAVPPVATFLFSKDSVCRQDTVIYVAQNPQNGSTYTWNFGTSAIPSGTVTGPGPHRVRYTAAGAKQVRLIAENAFGQDTLVQTVRVFAPATANFTAQSNALVTTFTNTSANATSYLWDFGDNTSSTEKDPVHTYAAEGTYTVKLRSTGPCRFGEKTLTITVNTVGIETIDEKMSILATPNPTDGDFKVEFNSTVSLPVQLRLLDAQGRLVKMQETTIKTGRHSVAFTDLKLPKGLYQLQVQSEIGTRTLSIAVQ